MSEHDSSIRWWLCGFEQLSSSQLYAILAARVSVFVVEQDCPYQDVDGLDDIAIHVWAEDAAGKLLAYARILPPGVRFDEPAIGRVLTTTEGRGKGIGRELMHRSLLETDKRFPGQAIRISAQQYLERFYTELGFETVSGPYLEDDIPHLEMLRPAGAAR
jgi:ElaA protein